MTKFILSMHHSKSTIYKLSLTRYSCFYAGQKFLCYIIAGFLLALGIQNNKYGIWLIVLGCFLITGATIPARRDADKTVDALNGNYPNTKFLFQEESILYGDVSDRENDYYEMNYNELTHLLEDPFYYYLFAGQRAAYMLSKQSIQKGTLEEFKRFMESKTGQRFRRPKSALFFSIKDIPFFNRKKEKK